MTLWSIWSNSASLHRACSSSILRLVAVLAGVGALAVSGGPAGERGRVTRLGLPASIKDMAEESMSGSFLVVFVALDCCIGPDKQVGLVVKHDNDDGNQSII